MGFVLGVDSISLAGFVYGWDATHSRTGSNPGFGEESLVNARRIGL